MRRNPMTVIKADYWKRGRLFCLMNMLMNKKYDDQTCRSDSLSNNNDGELRANKILIVACQPSNAATPHRIAMLDALEHQEKTQKHYLVF